MPRSAKTPTTRLLRGTAPDLPPATRRALSRIDIRLRRLSARARASPDRAFDDLSALVDLDLLRVAYHRSLKGHAPHHASPPARRFARHLERNLEDLLQAFRDDTYVIPPSVETTIPKPASGTRTLLAPPFRDKVLQRAVVLLLHAIYEPLFSDSSFAYRPHRSAHQALARLRRGLAEMAPCLVLDLDVEACFDSLDRARLGEFLDRRLRDPKLRRMIAGWLRAGRDGGPDDDRPLRGVPQGAVVSPLLANVFLDQVLDRWFEGLVIPKLWGSVLLVRYADDAVVLFTDEMAARQQRILLPKRFATFGLTLHPGKTRLLRFGPGHSTTRDRGHPHAASFDFLGLTHYWATDDTGAPVVRRKMSHLKFRRFVREMREWCREVDSRPLWWQHRELGAKLTGLYSYYRPAGCRAQLDYLRDLVAHAWHRQVLRRAKGSPAPRRRLLDFLARHPLPGPSSGLSVQARRRRTRERAREA